MAMTNIFSEMVTAIEANERFALGIISRTKGSSPQKKGAKALFFADGRIVGTLGGGCLEAEVRERARRALATREPATFDLVLDHDFGWDDGLICGGKVSGLILPNVEGARELWRELAKRERAVTWGVAPGFRIESGLATTEDSWLYRETVMPPCPLWIAGSGHVAQALVPLAQQLDFAVTLFDDRAALANHERFPHETRLRVGGWAEILSDTIPDLPTFGIIVTRGHQHDALVLREWVQRPFALLGMIGSRRKRQIIFDQFLTDGLATQEEVARVECPVGLDIQAVSVPEIAVSIAARLVQRRAELGVA